MALKILIAIVAVIVMALVFAALKKAMSEVVADGDYAKLLARWKMPPSSAAY